MTISENTANATLRVECGQSRGSGFHFIKPNLIVTNNHVVEGTNAPVEAVTEDGLRMPLRLLASSATNEHDFAIFEAQCRIPDSRCVLHPKVVRLFRRGADVVFSGFPHGIPDLLVQRAVVAGLRPDGDFYLDGSVNGGNSGGPIVDTSDGGVVGIITQRRFLGGAKLAMLESEAERIREHCQRVAGSVRIEIMGMDFGGFSRLIADSMSLMREVLEANANSGIGVGFPIEFVADRCRQSGLISASTVET